MLLYSDLTYKIRKAVFNVYNELGFGHKEHVYQEALEEEFNLLRLPYKREVNLKVYYKDKKIGDYRPDFIIDDKIIIEIKAVEFMPIINFGRPKLQIKRLIWTT